VIPSYQRRFESNAKPTAGGLKTAATTATAASTPIAKSETPA
jgi:hypothetical protein